MEKETINDYVLVSAITCLVLGIMWSRSSVPNVIVKIFLIGLGIVGAFCWLTSKGFVLVNK